MILIFLSYFAIFAAGVITGIYYKNLFDKNRLTK